MFEAVRRERVVSVSIPLRRVTILGLTLSVPALLLHHEVEYMQEHLAIPNWAWIVIGAGALLISRLHEGATHLTDRYFNRDLDHAERSISGRSSRRRNPWRSTGFWPTGHTGPSKLSSAASFRRNGAGFSATATAMAGREDDPNAVAGYADARALGEGSAVSRRRGIRDRTRTSLRVQPPGARGPGGKSAPLLSPLRCTDHTSPAPTSTPMSVRC